LGFGTHPCSVSTNILSNPDAPSQSRDHPSCPPRLSSRGGPGRCEEIAKRVIRELEDEVGETAAAMTEKDKDAFLQLVSYKLDDEDEISTLVEDIIEEIKERLRFVKEGEFDRDSL
jgi:hypothetical protein